MVIIARYPSLKSRSFLQHMEKQPYFELLIGNGQGGRAMKKKMSDQNNLSLHFLAFMVETLASDVLKGF